MNPRALLRVFALVVALLLSALPAGAEEVWRVVRNVRLLTKPSIAGLRIKTLHPEELVYATGGKSGDYIRVRDEADDLGWVYAPYLTEANDEEEGGGDGSGTEAPPSPAGEASAISPSWEKPAPQAMDFHLHGKTCGPTGQGTETETNRRKNRIDVPSSYHAVTFDAVDNLPYPHQAKTQRSKWSPPDLAAIAPYEGVALTVTGYLVALKPQSSSQEACNCGWSGAEATDWHMALVGQPGEPESEALVVETTPRIRIKHPGWTTTNLSPWKNSQDPIRVSGWLMMDPQHKGHLGTFRNTLWEIHPITRIEVMRNGSWVDLDALGPS